MIYKSCRKDFADYAEFCFKTYGDRVKNWFSFNEPRVVADLGYDTRFFAPGRCSKAFGNCTAGDSATEPYIVAHNLILSHAAAAHRYRENYQVGLYILFFSSLLSLNISLSLLNAMTGEAEGKIRNYLGFCLVRTTD